MVEPVTINVEKSRESLRLYVKGYTDGFEHGKDFGKEKCKKCKKCKKLKKELKVLEEKYTKEICLHKETKEILASARTNYKILQERHNMLAKKIVG